MAGTRLAYAAVVGGKTTPAAPAPPPVVVAAAAHPPIERTDRKTGSRHAQAPVAPAPIVSAWTAKTVANCSSGNACNDAAAGKNLGAKEVIDSSTASYKSDLSERPELDDEKGRSREGEPENQSISKAAAPQKSKCDKEFLLRRQTSSRSMRSYLCNLAYRFSLNFAYFFSRFFTGAWKKPDSDVAHCESLKDITLAEETMSKSSRQGKKSGVQISSIKKEANVNRKNNRSAGKHGNRPKQVGKNNGKSGNKGKKKGSNPNRHSKKNRSSRNKKQQQKARGSRMYPQPLSPAQFEQLKLAVVRQVEYFFSADELSRNTHLRSNMDSEGFLPAAIVFNFPSIAAYCFPYYDLFAALLEKATFLEIDEANETLRRKENYKKWLIPDGKGGFGCPRWIKEKTAPHIQTTSLAIEGASDQVVKDSSGKVKTRSSDESSNDGSGVTPDTASCTDSEQDQT